MRASIIGAALVLAGVLAACEPSTTPADPSPTEQSVVQSSPSPSPSTGGLRLGFILPPADLADASVIEDYRSAAQRFEGDDQIGEVRVVAPDEAAYVVDMAVLLAREGYDMVCATGPRAERIVRAAAAYPGTLFCAAPVRLDSLPSNLVAVDMRVDETARLAGVAAAVVGGESPIGMVTGASTYDLERTRTAFEGGARSVATPGGVLFSPVVGDEEQTTLHTNAQLAEGASVVTVIGGETVMQSALDRVVAESGLAVTIDAVPGAVEEAVNRRILVSFDHDPYPALRAAVDRLVSGSGAMVRSVGWSDGAFSLIPGGSPRTTAAMSRLGPMIDALRSEPSQQGAG